MSAGVPYFTPAPFVWDEEQSSFLIYSGPEGDRERLVHIRQKPNVGLHLNMRGADPAAIADTLILTGEAAVSVDDPPADQVEAFVEKYQEFLANIGMTLQQAAVVSPIALRVRRLMMMVTSYE
jgi:PPOX class probable F420-dependent enzyme